MTDIMLHDRECPSSGLHVELWRDEPADTCSIYMEDNDLSVAVTFPVPCADAMDAFTHPWPYYYRSLIDGKAAA